MGGEGHRVVRKFDDVDLLAAQLADNGLNSHALHADTSAHAVDIPVTADDGDLGAFPGFASTTFDHPRVVVDFWYFLLEQAGHQLRGSAGDDHPSVLSGLFDTADDAADAITGAEVLQLALLFLGQTRLGLAEIDHQILGFDALDGAVDQLADAARVLGKNRLALGLAHFLQDHLLGRLRGDASQRIGRLREMNLGFELRRRIHLLSFLEGNFLVGILNRFHDFLDSVNLQGSGLIVEGGHQVFGGAEMLTRGHEHGVFHRVDDDLRINALLFAQDFNGLIDATHCVPLNSIKLSGGELPLKLQVGFFDLRKREANCLSGAGFQRDDSIGKISQLAYPAALIFDRLP